MKFLYFAGRESKNSEKKPENSSRLHFWVTSMLCLFCSIMAIGFGVYVYKLRKTSGERLQEKRDNQAQTDYKATTEH